MINTRYYCNKCSREKYATPDIYSMNLTGSLDGYQLNKYLKHTLELPFMGYTSSFIDKSFESYRDFTIKAVILGSLEVTERPGRQIEYNYVFVASTKIGELFFNGNSVCDENAVKVVLSNNPDKIHSYSTGSFGISQAICHECGSKLITH